MHLPDERSGLLAKQERGDNSPALTVGELAGSLKRVIEGEFAHVRVRGEISGFKRHSSGHCYLSLKDEAACMDAVIWRGNANGLAFRPEDGAEVIATGKMTTYSGRSKYQLVIERLELAGEGALMALLEKRRKALAAEGLFDAGRKRELPFLPLVIGVITSPTGAVIRDILHRLEDRCPTRVIVWPVPVQGDGASGRIATAIRGFAAIDGSGAIPRPELLIVARGGGSIEDLWAFNEEEVVRAAAESPIPLISAVGHETDTTLIDHASDRRAPTPTAAAEMAVPVRAELLALIDELGRRGGHCLSRKADRARERFDLTVCRWPDAGSLFAPAGKHLAEIGARLPRSLASCAGNARANLNAVAPRLRGQLLLDRVSSASEKLASLWRLAELGHPDRPLHRGFARITDRAGTTVSNVADALSARLLTIHFADGQIEASAGAGAAPVERKRRSTYGEKQPGFFDPAED